jgi:hypothetical protein
MVWTSWKLRRLESVAPSGGSGGESTFAGSDGLERRMAFEGNLETMPVADLLQWASNGRYTGTIRVANAEITKMIYIRKGDIVSCTSTDPREFLGHFLVSQGAIDETDLQGAIIDQDRHSGLLGQLLVQRGAISEERLEEMLRIKAEEAIFDLFTWTSGQFRFIEGELPGFEMVPISLGVQGLVLEGMRRLDEWERISEAIPSMLAVPVSVRPLLEDAEDMDPGCRSVLESVDDDRSIEDICLHTHSTEFYVCDILFREIQMGRIKVVRPRSSVRRGETAAGMSGESLVKVARDHLESGEFETAIRHLQAAASLEPHDRVLREKISGVEGEVRERLAECGIGPTAVPELAIVIGEMSELDLEPSEGFILSRIDGVGSLGNILKISPLTEIDALLVIWKLVRGGQLRLK